ncbi:MAG TPA: alpha/beta hydrolase family protein [Pyrinomonadaceae bacterium]|jgi:S-formylglutathione hydrolase FrmB|nr:alpha/beta hydrolase family protein [Pyrinomonadaceae bacterium]
MTRHARILLLLVALFVAADARAQATAKTAATPTPAPAREGKKEKPRYETVQFESKLVGAALPYNVILPADYRRGSSKHKRYPVVYLLHGLKGSANDWVSDRAHLADYAARYPFIIVVPEGHDGWYTDSATVPSEKYESYIVEELIPDVDRRFRTIASREGRAVAGLSMGGYGSLKFGLKHPELFAFAASMSGALLAPSLALDDSTPDWIRPSIARVYGPLGTPTRRDNDIFRIVREMPRSSVASLPYFYLDCGTEDPFLQNSRDFSALLVEKKIPHEFRELPGTHGWPYWDRQVREILRLAAQKLAAPADDSKRKTKAASGR